MEVPAFCVSAFSNPTQLQRVVSTYEEWGEPRLPNQAEHRQGRNTLGPALQCLSSAFQKKPVDRREMSDFSSRLRLPPVFIK